MKNYFKLAQTTDVKLKLLPIEEQIFNFLIKAKNSFPETKNVTMRVAGGWVRDKILGVDSDDIDIAISNMTGGQFVKKLVEYGKSLGQNNPIGKVYIVDQNIEKSKQLETAGIDIFGQKVEFVNLRTEIYDENSRIPKMTLINEI